MAKSIKSSAILVGACSSLPVLSGDLCFESIFQSAAIGIAICGVDRRIVRSNATLDRMLGYEQEELNGLSIADLMSPEDAAEDNALLSELLSGEKEFYRLDRKFLQKANKAVWGRHTASIARAKAGEAIAVVEMIEDITAHKRAQEQLIEAQKMEAIGRLVGGVAHDFNNLLTGIMLYCDLLIAGVEQDARLSRHASEIHVAAEHGAALVQQLLTVARKRAVEPRILHLNETATSMHNLLTRLIGEQIELCLDLEAGLWPVLLDSTQAQQIILNLVLNAKDAMPSGGQIVISTRNSEQQTRTYGQCRRVVSLVVSDTGCGMDANTRARLFEPFFTTKEVGKGNGLGLATVYRIVHDGGGAILVESEEGRGSRIEIVLPGVINYGEAQTSLLGFAAKGNGKG